MVFQKSAFKVVLWLSLVSLVIGLPLNGPQTQRNDPAYEMFRTFAGNFPQYANPMNFIPGGFPGGFPGGYPGGFPGGNGYFPGGQFPFGGGNPFAQYPGAIYGQYPGQVPYSGVPGVGQITSGQYGYTKYPILNGMGYAGPFYGSEIGVANPGYGNTGGGNGGPSSGTGAFPSGTSAGGVPIVNTRFNNGVGSFGRPGSSSSSVVQTKDGGQVAVSVKSSPDGRPVFRTQTVQGPNSFGTAFAFASP